MITFEYGLLCFYRMCIFMEKIDKSHGMMSYFQFLYHC